MACRPADVLVWCEKECLWVGRCEHGHLSQGATDDEAKLATAEACALMAKSTTRHANRLAARTIQ